MSMTSDVILFVPALRGSLGQTSFPSLVDEVVQVYIYTSRERQIKSVPVVEKRYEAQITVWS
jgi:hypothetical protein